MANSRPALNSRTHNSFGLCWHSRRWKSAQPSHNRLQNQTLRCQPGRGAHTHPADPIHASTFAMMCRTPRLGSCYKTISAQLAAHGRQGGNSGPGFQCQVRLAQATGCCQGVAGRRGRKCMPLGIKLLKRNRLSVNRNRRKRHAVSNTKNISSHVSGKRSSTLTAKRNPTVLALLGAARAAP
jgi:hypothetical protein